MLRLTAISLKCSLRCWINAHLYTEFSNQRAERTCTMPQSGQRVRAGLLRRACRIVAFFQPNSQACESCLVTSASDVFMGAARHPVTFFQTVPSTTCAERPPFYAITSLEHR